MDENKKLYTTIGIQEADIKELKSQKEAEIKELRSKKDTEIKELRSQNLSVQKHLDQTREDAKAVVCILQKYNYSF